MNKETINIKRLSFVYARRQQRSEKKFICVCMNRRKISSFVFIIRFLYQDAQTLSVYYVPVKPMLTKRYFCINVKHYRQQEVMQILRCTKANYTENSVLYRFKSLRCNQIKDPDALIFEFVMLERPSSPELGCTLSVLISSSLSLFLPTKQILQTKETSVSSL